MKNMIYTVLSMLFFIQVVSAQTARMQVIHNSADAAAAVVDIYLWNGDANSLVIKLDDFAFRAATPFVDVPAGDSLAVIVAGPTSMDETDQVVATIPVGDLQEDNTYVVIASGLVTPGNYAVNPDGIATGFELLIKDMARESAANGGVDFFVNHGSTDAPTVDVLARGVTKLVEDAAYRDITPYINVPAGSYTLDVTPGMDNSTIVASFTADLSALEGGSAVVFASGFLSPGDNGDGPAFGIFAALAGGEVVAFPATSSARMQVIHNSADAAATVVDIYLWNGDANSLVIKLDDFAFRAATPFVDVPAGDSLAVIVAGPTSMDETDQVVATIPVGDLMNGNTYVVIASGLVTPGNYAANPDGIATGFELLIKDMARESAANGGVDFFVNHGSTDAPTVDVLARGVTKLVEDAAYRDITPYINVPAGSYTLDVTPGMDNSTIVASFTADLSALEGGSAVVFASGFLSPGDNGDGPAFGIFAALAGGEVVAFPATSSARMQVIHNSADAAATVVDIYLWNGDANSLVIKLDDFAFRAATPFVDVPAGDSLAVIVAGPTSMDETDQVVATIPVGDLMNGNTYVVIASGLVTPGNYAANPDGIATGFELLIKDMARESAANGGVDFFVNHGSTDAPTVDVLARGVTKLVEDAAYRDITPYINVPAGSYTLDVTPGMDNSTIVVSFTADLSALEGGSAVVFASGFLSPGDNGDGPGFGIFAALTDGTVVPFSTVSSIEDDLISGTPRSYELSQNFPNPFNPSTNIRFSLPVSQYVTLKIYDAVGQAVATLIDGKQDAGQFEITFNAGNLASGIYFYRLEAEEFSAVKQMMLIK